MGSCASRLRVALIASASLWSGCGARSELAVEGPDAGLADAGTLEGGAPDDSTEDAAPGEGGPTEAGPIEAGVEDGTLDAPGPDAGAPDGTALDAPAVDAGDGPDSAPVLLAAPRPVAPLSTATVTSQTPVFRWALAPGEDGAEVDVYRDRACTTPVTTVAATGSSVVLPTALLQGVYFWRLRGATGSVVGTATSPVWELFVGAASAPQNTSWGTTLDVNGDGFADVMVNAPGSSGSGTTYVYLGGAGGLSATFSTLTYASDGDGYFNRTIASAGDVDGDGFGDVVIASPNLKTGAASVLLYAGGPDGPSATPVTLPLPAYADAGYGLVVASAGDVNGDGYADVIVGTPYANTMAGSAFLYYGGSGGLATAPTVLTAGGDLPSDLYAYYGRAVAAADVNGDGFGDVAIGAIQGKEAFVYLGSATGLSTSPQVLTDPDVPVQPDQNPSFGSTLASAGDVNGDGFADLLVGAPDNGDNYATTGSTYLYLGSAAGISTSPIALASPTADSGEEFGTLLAGAGDVDGDGYADMLVATETESYLYLGGPTGPSTRPIALLGGVDNEFGSGALAGAGDVDGDGYAEVLVGSPWSAGYMGAAYLYAGSATGPGMPVAVTNPGVANSYFGAALARGTRRTWGAARSDRAWQNVDEQQCAQVVRVLGS